MHRNLKALKAGWLLIEPRDRPYVICQSMGLQNRSKADEGVGHQYPEIGRMSHPTLQISTRLFPLLFDRNSSELKAQ